MMTAEPVAPSEPEATPPVVKLRGLHRSFGDNPALTDLDLEVPHEKITVLLGPNGAGKTTAIRMITGALGPDAGTVSVFGLDPDIDGQEVRNRCGVVSAKPSLYDRLSGRDNLAYAAELYGLGRGDLAAARIDHASERFGITEALQQQVGGYSTGMKTRLALARSVLHEPELVLYDEPTSGLDPESSHAVLELIREMTADGNTVLMCTHLLLEAEGLADQVVVLDHGTDLISGTPRDLTQQFWPGAVVRLDAENRADLEPLRDVDGVMTFATQKDGSIELQLDDEGRIPDLVLVLAAQGVRLTRVEPHRPNLEDLYFAVRKLGRPNRVGEVESGTHFEGRPS
jgi:ABC-2 type transport system ATP-binding protein